MKTNAPDDGGLDRAFMALADPVRRGIIARLSRGPATVNELAEPFAISKQAVSKHIQVLENARLVTRTRDAQRRPVHLDAATLESLTAWIDKYRLVHEQQFRSLDALLASGAANATPSATAPSDSHQKSNTGKKSNTQKKEQEQ
jgi:DNA-binding transcriptional ArsR family regulator